MVSRLPGFILLVGTLLAASDAMACRELVKFDDHLTGDTAGWHAQYRLAKIVSVSSNQLVVDIVRRFDEQPPASGVVLNFIPGEQAYAVCPTRFEAGQTYLIHVRVVDGQEQISRFNGYDMPATHPKYSVYVRDLESASAVR